MAKTERKRTSAEKTTRTERTVRAARTAAVKAPASGKVPAAARKKKSAGGIPDEVTRAIDAALDKKAQDLIVLDLRNTPAFTDFFVVCTGLNQRQVKAIADSVEAALKGAGVRPAHTEGYDRADWVLMDFFTFIVHVFTPQTRAFYALERLWGDAERIEVKPQEAKA
jgi:ribosome-associated protein